MSRSIHTIRYSDLFHCREPIAQLSYKVSSKTKVILFSDSHFDLSFDQQKFNLFKKLIISADLIVINGDFWADKFVTFDEFINSPYANLFPLLKSKNTYYIFGNHDMPIHSDPRIYRFCNHAGFSLKLTAGSLHFHIEHGHLRSGFMTKYVLKTFEMHPKILYKLTYPFNFFTFIQCKLQKLSGQFIFKFINTKFKKNWNEKTEYLVIGHTHIPEFDQIKKFINLGLTHDDYFTYTIVHNNHIRLVLDER